MGPINDKIKEKEKMITINGMNYFYGKDEKGKMVYFYGTERVLTLSYGEDQPS